MARFVKSLETYLERKAQWFTTVMWLMNLIRSSVSLLINLKGNSFLCLGKTKSTEHWSGDDFTRKNPRNGLQVQIVLTLWSLLHRKKLRFMGSYGVKSVKIKSSLWSVRFELTKNNSVRSLNLQQIRSKQSFVQTPKINSTFSNLKMYSSQ